MGKNTYDIFGGRDLMESGDYFMKSTVQEYYRLSFVIILVLVILVIYLMQSPKEEKEEKQSNPMLYQGSSFGGVLSSGEAPARISKQQPMDRDEAAYKFALKKTEDFTTYEPGEPMNSEHFNENEASLAMQGF